MAVSRKKTDPLKLAEWVKNSSRNQKTSGLGPTRVRVFVVETLW